jgi:predicted  nucleic acid-binding Zn-ribbon protein
MKEKSRASKKDANCFTCPEFLFTDKWDILCGCPECGKRWLIFKDVAQVSFANGKIKVVAELDKNK